ncbi:hypothetical protein Hanom_Chr04g00346751 [Helianthus anomalus]
MLTLSLLVLFKSAYIKNSYIQTMTLYIRLPGFKASDQFRSAHSCTLLAHLLIRATSAHLDSYASSHKYKPCIKNNKYKQYNTNLKKHMSLK